MPLSPLKIAGTALGLGFTCCLALAGESTSGESAPRESTLDIRPIALPGEALGSVLATEDGYLLSWTDREGPRAHLRFAALDDEGQTVRTGEIAQGEDWFVNWADFPALQVADNGDWIAFFLRRIDPSKPYAYGIWITRSTDRGQSWSAPTLAHDDGTATEHGFVSLLPDGEDRVLMIWLDGRRSALLQSGDEDREHAHGGAHTALHSAVSTRGGMIEHAELDSLTCDCCRTSVARGTDGPVVLYRDRTADEIRDVYFVQRISGAWSQPQIVLEDQWTMPGCPVNGPSLIAKGGGLQAAWPTQADGTPTLRLAQRADDQWRAQPNLDRGDAVQGRVDLASWSDDESLAVWMGGDSEHAVLKLAWLGADGAITQTHELASLPRGRSTGMPRIASQPGRALVVWTEVIEADATQPGSGKSRTRLQGALVSAATN